MKVITITLNPAFDIHCYAESFQPFCENLAEVISNDAGGKGINISRVLTMNGVCNVAYVVLGDENGEAFLKKLDCDKIDHKDFYVHGRIRENITLHAKNQPETRISFSGFTASKTVIDSIRQELEKEDLENSIVTLTGRIPSGLDVEYLKELLLFLKDKGAKIVIDSRSFNKKDIIDVKPWLIKPNEEEIRMYSSIAVNDLEDAKTAAQKLKSEGIENIIISLGEKGAVLCCSAGTFAAKPPEIKAVSTIGAGDSSIAGFISAISRELSYEDALKTAVAYGSAACLTEGTKPPQKKDIEAIFDKI